MSGPAIALVAIGGTLYTVIGLYMAYGLAALFAMGDEIRWWQVLLCLLAIPLWAPGLILFWMVQLFLLPLGG